MHTNSHINPVIIASENGRAGAIAGMELLHRGGSAMDAAELAARVTEDDPEEHSVGFSGLPNLLGQVELDASLMNGRTLESGAVAGVQDYGNVISLARKVMEELPHVLLMGRGAERFAGEMGQKPADQRSFASLERWRKRFEETGVELTGEELRHLVTRLTVPMHLRDRVPHGTVNFLVRDSHGDLASAVSTSGLGWKYPGRVGDSPIIGAGNYCDNRYGAVACTGSGELAIRVSTARSLILYMKMGMDLAAAGQECLAEIEQLSPRPGQYMNIVAMTPDGQHAGFSTTAGKRYLYYTGEMAEPQMGERMTSEPV
ncbi:MAG: isoaspartyl peptidase/L-asparaginase [Caldilineaceae bacterium]|nr:isoaspartyl peptidase/L-asparaginase [Caldilineaceae bacterium]HRJ45469.1 isoaspartyl peptidase/L-asparaginase [Caldilineaceae bacterium]